MGASFPCSQRLWWVAAKATLGDRRQLTKGKSGEGFYSSGLERAHAYHFSSIRTMLHGLAQLQGWSLPRSPGSRGGGLGDQLARLQPIGISSSWAHAPAQMPGPAEGS